MAWAPQRCLCCCLGGLAWVSKYLPLNAGAATSLGRWTREWPAGWDELRDWKWQQSQVGLVVWMFFVFGESFLRGWFQGLRSEMHSSLREDRASATGSWVSCRFSRCVLNCRSVVADRRPAAKKYYSKRKHLQKILHYITCIRLTPLTLSMPEYCIKLRSPGSGSNLFCSRGAHGTREAFDRL